MRHLERLAHREPVLAICGVSDWDRYASETILKGDHHGKLHGTTRQVDEEGLRARPSRRVEEHGPFDLEDKQKPLRNCINDLPEDLKALGIMKMVEDSDEVRSIMGRPN